MKERFKKRKRLDVFIALCMSVILLLGMIQTVFASGSLGSKRDKGSLSMTLAVAEDGNKVSLKDIPFSLYQVGTMDTEPKVEFQLDSRLSATGVDLNALETAAEAESASHLFANVVGSAGITPLTGITDANGNILFGELPKGVYLLVQSGKVDECKASPMLLSIPYAVDGPAWEYDVEAFPKAEKVKQEDKKGNLTVTKKLYTADEFWNYVEICAADATYYVRLFLDESATIPYGDVKAIHIQGQSSGSVTYTDLAPGTYYLRETDAQGNPMPLEEGFIDDTGAVVNCTITVNDEDTTEVTFDAREENFSQESVVENLYTDIPDGFYMERLLWIQKNVIEDGEQITTDDKFYATVNEIDLETGEETTIMTVELKQNDKVRVTFHVMDIAEKDVLHTYRVFESDEEGNPVDKETFGYTVGGEGKVSFVGEDNEKTITITNTVSEEEEEEEKTPTVTPTVTPIATTTSSTDVRTGDQTPIVMWIVILCVAAVAVGAVVVYRKKK